jgi:hypothetical protein
MKYNEAIDGDDIGICMGSIDLQSVQGEGLKLLRRKHIFVGEKASWFEVPEGEERFVGHEEGFQRRIDGFLKTKGEEEKEKI